VVSDVRYPNEADAIKALGGSVWRINRLGVFAANDHASEHALDDYDFTGTIENSSSINELNRQLEEVLLNGEAVRA
jgi:hypothetical protein